MTRLHPVTLGESFGWLHEDGTCRRAALILPPIGYDLLGAHQTLHLAADLLAGTGIVALRLDYPGFGDALDPAPSDARIPVWLASVHAAIDWLKATTSCHEVVVMGVRFGAALAAAATAARSDISHLVLLEPVLDGAAFVREQRVISRMVMARDIHGEVSAPADGIEIEGFLLDTALVEELRQFKPLQTPLAKAPAVICMSTAQPPALAAWGVPIEALDFRQRAALELTAIPPAPPREDLERLVATLEGGPARPFTWHGDEAVLRTSVFTERAMRFGASGDLAGVLCQPAQPSTDHVLIILNTGAIHHIGNGRIWVDEARDLASRGVASFRMDIAGLGDSVCRIDGPRSVLYREERAADVSAAIDHLTGQGFRSFTVCGICSGAYLAMHAGFDDPRIGHVVVFNPQITIFGDGPRDMDGFLTRSVSGSKVYMDRFSDPERWKRLLRGEVDIRAVMRSVGGMVQRRVGKLAASGLAVVDRIFPRPSLGRRIWSAFRGISERGGRMSMLFADTDVGLEEFNAHLGHYRGRVYAMSGVHIEVVPHCDHVFASRPAKAQLRRFLRERLDLRS